MGVLQRWKSLASVSVGLAAGGLCVNPLLAQQGSPGALPAAAQKADAIKAAQPDKEVMLTSDGRFWVVVRTMDGQPVPQARLTLTPAAKAGAEPFKVITGNKGESQVAGVKPGLYQARAEGPKLIYEGTLQVDRAAVDSGPITQIVVFTLQPAPEEAAPPAATAAPAAAGTSASGFSGRTALLLGLGGAAVATAIAVPLSLSSSGGGQTPPTPVASP